MSDIAVQASFNSGEWSPSLYARVDVQKYRSGATRIENFFVDYRGGVSSRFGTKYVLQAYNSGYPVRVIPFQASYNVGYILEFGQNYVRFHFEGAPVLENAYNISAITRASPAVATVTGNDWSNNDWIFIQNVVGMTQINGQYYNVNNVSGAAVSLGDLQGVDIDSTGYTAYSSGGTAARVYTIVSPYTGAELAELKFTQNGASLIICHPNHPPYVLTLISATNWTLAAITFGTTASAPTLTHIGSSLPWANFYTTPPQPGQTYYNYAVTAVDQYGQESSISNIGTSGPSVDIRTYPGSNIISWNPVTGAVRYNLYEAELSYFGVSPAGAVFGYIGYSTGTQFIDSNIGPDFSETPPISNNPFIGAGVQYVTMTNAGSYTTVPTVTFTGGSPAITALGTARLGITGSITVSAGGSSYNLGDTINFGYGVVCVVSGISTGAVTALTVQSYGWIVSGSTPSNPVAQVTTSGSGTGCTATFTWGVLQIIMENEGAGYGSAPTVVFGSGAAAGTAVLGGTSGGNPTVPAFFQQRLFLGGPTASPATFYMSMAGAPYNFNYHNPIQPEDSITGTLVAPVLNTIKSAISIASGLLVFTDKASWVINGGSYGSAVSPEQIVANAQSFTGASDVPPILVNYDILYVTSDGTKVRDLTYNIYFNTFTGEDISTISSHFFYGYSLVQWAFSEKPYNLVWAVRNDGIMLSLTFLKEQQFCAWAQHYTTGGQFESVASITEPSIAGNGYIDAVYTVVARTVNGHDLRYIERFAERYLSQITDAWCVDAGIEYNGSPATAFQGATHLAGLTCTGLADGIVIPSFVMPVDGRFTIPNAASVVVVGIGYECNLQTLPLDVGDPSIQGKVKKIPFVDVKVHNTQGLSIGSTSSTLTPMKDTVTGNVSSMLTGFGSQIVGTLYTGDARTFLDPRYTVPGQYFIQQAQPLPASILGVFPALVQGDDR